MSEISLEERLGNIQQRISQATARRAREEVEVENARASLAEAKERLKEEFGVVTSDDLRAKKTELESALQSAVEEIEAALEGAEE